MGNPFWKSFIKGYQTFAKELREKRIIAKNDFNQYRKKYPLLDDIIRTSISAIPFPFNDMATNIYNKFLEEDKIDAAKEVFDYLKTINDNGENNFKALASTLDTLVQTGAKQKTLVSVSREMIQNQSEFMSLLKKQGKKMDVMQNMMEKQNVDLMVIKQSQAYLIKLVERKESWVRK